MYLGIADELNHLNFIILEMKRFSIEYSIALL